MLHRTFWTERRNAGIMLILGCLLFLTAAGLTPTDEKGNSIYSLSQREALIAIFQRWSSWHWGLILFGIAVVLTLLGFAQLTASLRDAGDRMFSQMGLIAFVLAVAFFLFNTAFSMSIEYWAAQETARTNVIPALYIQLNSWMDALFGIYTALAFFAALAYGVALLVTRLLPRWLIWVTIVYNLALLVFFILAGGIPPFVHHLFPIVFGILLLLRRYQLPAHNHHEAVSVSSSPTVVVGGK